MRKSSLYWPKSYSRAIFAFIVTVIVFLSSGRALALIESIQITPENPTSEDIVLISVGGYFPDACWVAGETNITQQGYHIGLSITAWDAWTPDVACLTVIVPYEFGYEVGPLPAGTYTVTVTEYHESLRLPFPFYKSTTFTVACTNGECGDVNCDFNINIGDVVYIVNYIFRNGPAPEPLDMGDVNGDGDVNVADAVYLLEYIFRNGPPPVG